MKVTIAFDVEKTRKISFQQEFPVTTKCCRCDGRARLAFVAHEGPPEESATPDEGYIAGLHRNDPGGEGFWLHDCCCVAVFFCTECLEPTALYNQA